jgi:alpha-amylase
LSCVTLILCIHDHQPVGNLDGVFEHAYRSSYLPFLDRIENYPEIKFVLHTTGPLLEWLDANAPEYVERVSALVARGQVEILTGAFYEPILPGIPERDAKGQIELSTDYIERRFGVRPRGMWLAERVWEPGIAEVIAESGVEYVALDDYEFRLAGLPDDDLGGYFMTEDHGVPLKVFPISKRLRYLIPFAEPSETLDHLRLLAERGDDLVAVFGDDGEKFGVWPGTHKHVYVDGWLDRFLQALGENSDWLELSTFAEFIDSVPARGRVYLPSSSYPEMMEWALPTVARREYHLFIGRLKRQGWEERWGAFVSGGTWKGFLSKYDEANHMARKMYRVSGKVENAASDAVTRGRADAGNQGVADHSAKAVVAAAKEALWKGQCNCAYWHGVFGGIYLPHLRAAIYQHLIRAENLLDAGRESKLEVSAEVVDHDLDGNQEVLLESKEVNAYVHPSRGGMVFELDLRRAEWNVLATMARHEEAYHHALENSSLGERNDETVSIHDAMVAKETGLSELVHPDAYPRVGAIDHILPVGVGLSEMRDPAGSDLVPLGGERYEFEVVRCEGSAGVKLVVRAGVPNGSGTVPIELTKTVRLDTAGRLRVSWSLRAEGTLDAVFASEWTLALLTGHPDYAELVQDDDCMIRADSSHELESCRHLAVKDRIRREVVRMDFGGEVGVWIHPLETASQSESGFEKVYQGITILPHWRVSLAAGETAAFEMTLDSAALGEE